MTKQRAVHSYFVTLGFAGRPLRDYWVELTGGTDTRWRGMILYLDPKGHVYQCSPTDHSKPGAPNELMEPTIGQLRILGYDGPEHVLSEGEREFLEGL